MSELSYKPGLAATLERLRALYERRAPDRILASFEIHSTALERFAARYTDPFCEYPDPRERVAFWDELLRERAELEDDSLPLAYLSEFDQGLYGGLVGGDVRFMPHPENGWISSMVPPLLADWSEFPRLRLDAQGAWQERYRRQLAIFVEGARGKFGISHFILIDGLNFVFELVGATRTYTSLLDVPEFVRAAIELAFTVNHEVQRTFFDMAPLLAGGTCSNMAQWIPGRIVSESVDPFHMASVDYFEEWGRRPAQRIFDKFDGGVLHLHGNGRHLLEAVATLRGLKAIYLGDDRGYPPAYECLPDFRKRVPHLPFVLQIPLEAFLAGMERSTLTGGVFYKVQGVIHVDEANRLAEKVRRHRTG
jgi:hypothetical protein